MASSDKNMISGGRKSFSGLFRFRPLANVFWTKRVGILADNCCITEFAVSSVFLMLFGRNYVAKVTTWTLQFRLFSFRFLTKSVQRDIFHHFSRFVDLATVFGWIFFPRHVFLNCIFVRFPLVFRRNAYQSAISRVDDFVNFPLVLGRNGSPVAKSLICPICVLLHAMVFGLHNIEGDESVMGALNPLCVDVLNVSCDPPMGPKGAIVIQGRLLGTFECSTDSACHFLVPVFSVSVVNSVSWCRYHFWSSTFPFLNFGDGVAGTQNYEIQVKRATTQKALFHKVSTCFSVSLLFVSQLPSKIQQAVRRSVLRSFVQGAPTNWASRNALT